MKSSIQRVSEREHAYVREALENGFRVSTKTAFRTRLEEAFARRYGMRFAISMSNGTAAIHAALEAAGIGAGDEVIVPALTMSSPSLAVLQANATPVFADVDRHTWVMDAKSIEAVITPRTRAIVTVALYGLSPPMLPIMELARKHNLLVIEDNAQAMRSFCDGALAGTLGYCGIFSFQSSKHLAAGEGGMVITNDEAYATKIRKAAGLGFATLNARKTRVTKGELQHPAFERHDSPGWNYQMPELCCAAALAQLERADELVAARIESARLFLEAIRTSGSSLLTPQRIPENCVSSYWTLACELDTARVQWADFRSRFLASGGDKFYAAWQLTYLEPLFRDALFGARSPFIERRYPRGLCPVSEAVQPRLVQFKTNYWGARDAQAQAEILQKTLQSF
ncbi:MAG: DegT/DnrJ/EryC1/StrS family aminotransferase [Limisphaerales bacterium]